MASNGNTEAVKLLLERGATINAKNNRGFTPLHWAAKNGLTPRRRPTSQERLLPLFIQVAKDNDGNHCAALDCHMASLAEVVGLLGLAVSLVADINAKNNDGNTVLHALLHLIVAGFISYCLKNIYIISRRTTDSTGC